MTEKYYIAYYTARSHMYPMMSLNTEVVLVNSRVGDPHPFWIKN